MKKIVIGVIITMLGAFLLFNNMGFFIPEVYHIVISWQMLIIAIGTVLLFDKPSNHRSAGIGLILIGALFLIPKMFSVSLGGVIVPLLIIVAGLGFIVKAATRRSENNEYNTWCSEHPNWKKHFTDYEKNVTVNNESVARKEYVFASSKEKWAQGKLKNVEIEAVFSGVELDFTQAELADGLKFAAYIKVKSVFSGVILYVPDDWNIMVQKTGIFGGFTDNRPNRVLQVSSDKLVLLEVEAVFGGGEIRCYE